jgi:antirestriction protein ArdC
MSRAPTTPRRDIHAEVTAKLIAAIEKGVGEPQMPWRRSSAPLFMPVNALTKKPYNGINIVSLWVAAELAGYTAPIWGTYRQYQELGAQVRKGEKASLVVFYKEFDVDPEPDNEDDNGKRRVARASFVFNADQVDGFELPPPPERLGPIERMASVDRFFAATGARVEHGGEQAYYSPVTDHIQMPEEGLFCGTDTMTRHEGYMAVLAHEHIHRTGHESRLNRNLSTRFGKAELAAEELVAEIGAAFLCAELGITQDVRPDHAAYIANWVQILKDDPKAIFAAAARASEAVAYLKGLQPSS